MENINLAPDYKIHFTMSSVDKVNYNHLLHDVPSKWKVTQGEGIKIGLLDSGVPNHKDVVGKIKAWKNFTTDDSELDKNGHATHCAGKICGESAGELGIVGIAPKAELYVGKVLSDDGVGNDEWLAAGIRWCIAQGCDIISMSLGAPRAMEGHFVQTRSAILEAYNKNIFLFAAAGNAGVTSVAIPAAWNEVFAIGAIDKDSKHAPFSNMGPEIDFVGLGVNVLSCYLNDTYALLSGTSMANPDIVGVAALILAEHRLPGHHNTPIKTFWDLRAHLIRLCTDLGSPGHDIVFGWGNPVFDEPSTILDPSSMGGIVKQTPPVPKKKWWEHLVFWK